MGVDPNKEAAKASEIMSRYGVSMEDQMQVVKILMSAGVEHCLNEQENLRDSNSDIVKRIYGERVH